MPYGIDTSWYQRNLDITAVAQAGNEFNIVKSVRANEPTLAEADGYRSNIDRTIDSPMIGKGHYAVPNNRNTPKQTAEVQARVAYRYDPLRDAFMLDNEPLDSYPVYWRDGDAADYFIELNRLIEAPFRQMWLYCPAHLTRTHQPWPRVQELGVRICWVSYGDNDPYLEDGEEPFLGGAFPSYDAHQFTSSYSIPGYSGLIDRIHVPGSVSTLFGGSPMPRTPAGAFAWARNEATHGAVLKNWAGWCEKFINNAGAFNQSFGSALLAGNASGPLRSDYAAAPVGAIVYWSGVYINGVPFGHDAFVYEQGPDPLLLMVSSAVDVNWGHNIGLIRLSRYQAKFGHPLRGWTLRHGTETLSRSGLAGGGTTPIINVQEEDEMIFVGVPVDEKEGRPALALSSGRKYEIPAGHEGIVKGTCSKAITELNAAQYDIIVAAWTQGAHVTVPATIDQEQLNKSLADVKLPAPVVDWAVGSQIIADVFSGRLSQ